MTTTAREEILARIRGALGDAPRTTTVAEAEAASPVDLTYRRSHATGDLLELFDERVTDYRATVVRVAEGDVVARIVAEVTGRGARNVVVPADADPLWGQALADAGVDVADDDPPLTAAELDHVDGVVTSAEVGIAETGTIVLDHTAGQGRRAVSLVPDLHVCIVRADRVVGDVPEAMDRLADSARAGNPMTWISGPSATSDIELSRVEGVHGPRTLVVLLVEG